MTIKRLDHVSVVVDDLAAAIAFFTALGMTIEGEAPVEGPWVDRVNGLEGIQVDIVMMRTPDGHGRLELTKFRHPELVKAELALTADNPDATRRQVERAIAASDANPYALLQSQVRRLNERLPVESSS